MEAKICSPSAFSGHLLSSIWCFCFLFSMSICVFMKHGICIWNEKYADIQRHFFIWRHYLWRVFVYKYSVSLTDASNHRFHSLLIFCINNVWYFNFFTYYLVITQECFTKWGLKQIMKTLLYSKTRNV